MSRILQNQRLLCRQLTFVRFHGKMSSEFGDPLDHSWGQRLPPKTDCLMTEACQSSQTLQNKFLILF